jgi:hypothetical protein
MTRKALWLTASIASLQLFFATPGLAKNDPAAEAAYQKARQEFFQFRASKGKKLRHQYQHLAQVFEKVATAYPKAGRAADALFTAAKTYEDLYQASWLAEDLDHSIALFRKVTEGYPKNPLADDAQLHVAMAYLEFKKESRWARKELALLVSRYPKSDNTPKAQRMLEDLGGPLPELALKEAAPKDKRTPQAPGKDKP